MRMGSFYGREHLVDLVIEQGPGWKSWKPNWWMGPPDYDVHTSRVKALSKKILVDGCTDEECFKRECYRLWHTEMMGVKMGSRIVKWLDKMLKKGVELRRNCRKIEKKRQLGQMGNDTPRFVERKKHEDIKEVELKLESAGLLLSNTEVLELGDVNSPLIPLSPIESL